MSKKNKKSRSSSSPNIGNKIQSFRSKIHPETERNILGIVFIAVATILILASFQNAGPAGNFLYKILANLFGLGYYLFPAILLIIGTPFLLTSGEEKNRILSITFLGGSFFIVSGLGLIDVLFPGKGGLVGQWMGAIEISFGNIAAVVITAAVLIASLLLILNRPLKLFRRQENKEEAITQLVVKTPEIPLPSSKSAESAETKPETETKEEIETETEKSKQGFIPQKSIGNIKNYVPPPLSLLKSNVEKPTAGDLRANANIIKRTLESFGIPVEMGEITIGPKVTRYTLKPAEGIKLSRITALNQDLALALAAHPIRIEAPIPGKSLIGIEIPNKSAAIVRLGSLMSFPEFTNSGPLGFILGRDVNGDPIVADISKMPHLLIAGATGSGKSVSIHALLISLLYKNSPDTLKLILVDPKRVELTIYNDIPHLIAPVITDGKKALGVFRWTIEEMEKRYEKLQNAGSRDIKSYNKSRPDNSLPYIMIVIDELADLMAAYGRDIENSIVRLAQMARATGIHLIVSTQRPSVEIITGLIKANITSRIALQVASQIDSRTILDASGAEKLLGGGDMLFISAELSKPKRIQGAYITEEELHKVTDFIRENNKISFAPDGQADESYKEEAVSDFKTANDIDFDSYADKSDDELYDEAMKVVRQAQKASASLLQRRLAIGYARAARLLDMMEERGIVGPGEGAKPREVYLDKENEV